MLDSEKIRSAVLMLGWPKAIYFACLLLLLRHVVTFDQCLILLLLAVAIDFLPSHKSRRLSNHRLPSVTNKAPKAAYEKTIKANSSGGHDLTKPLNAQRDVPRGESKHPDRISSPFTTRHPNPKQIHSRRNTTKVNIHPQVRNVIT